MRKKFKIAYARFFHESHSFSVQKTDIDKFKEREFFCEDEIFPNYFNTRTETGAFIDFIQKHGSHIVPIPIIAVAANPSGMVTQQAYHYILDYIVNHLKPILEDIDGLYLSLHGAMVVEGIPDPESEIIKIIRDYLKDIPIAITLDLHANLGRNTAELSNILVGYKTYPHTDQYETAEKALNLLYRYLTNEIKCKNHYKKLFMMPPSLNMMTHKGPMGDIIREAQNMERITGIHNVSIFGGFPYCDVEDVGMSIVVNADNNVDIQPLVHFLSSYIWEKKDSFIVQMPGAEEAIKKALKEKLWPTALVDFADCPGSGGSADTTGLLKQLVEMRLEKVAFAFISDAESVGRAIHKGVGQKTELHVGGKVERKYGEPIKLEGTIKTISDGIYFNKGPWATGLKVNFGRTVVFATGGIDIIITEGCQPPNDPQIFRRNGLEPTDYKILALKAKNHFRLGYKDIVKKVIPVDAPGVSGLDLTRFEYKHVPRPIWPLDNCDTSK